MNNTTFNAQYQLLDQLFPFFLVINQENKIIQTGKSIHKLFPQDILGENFDTIFLFL